MTGTLHGHSLHFLERLDRASGESSELALELYHTPDILRWVLLRVRIPEDRERVALSLDPGDEGPFLVATCEGNFVTCLGRDMKPTGLHVVPHGQLMAHRRDWLEDRERFALRQEIRGADSRFDHFMLEIMRRGIRVSREEFMAASALQVVLKNQYALYLSKYQIEAWRFFQRMVRGRTLDRTGDDDLRRFWEMHWGLGHLALLATMDGPRGFDERLPPILPGILVDLFRWGEMALCARALWGLGRLGRIALPRCKEWLRDAVTNMDWLAAVMGIAVIGMRHGKLAAEARRLLESPPPPQDRVGDASEYFRMVGPAALDMVRAVMDGPEVFDLYFSRVSRKVTVWLAGELKLGAPFDFTDMEAVPEDLARAVTVSWEHDLRTEKGLIEALAGLLPWLARCEAADLYPPQAWTDLVRGRWVRESSLGLIRSGMAYWGRNQPHIAEPRPGRNDPCPCGSGKKYKKCCLRTGG